MPVVFDFKCPKCGEQYEALLASWRSDNPLCPDCKVTTDRLPAAPAPIFTGSWGDFSDPKREYYNPDGVVAYRTKTSRNVDGSPEKVLLRTYQDVKTYCKDEGLINPTEMNPNLQVSKDGRKTVADHGRWI